jgi:hypothetical protein
MATFREVAYAIQDFSKTIVDDSIIDIDHIIFLMSKYRNYIINSNMSSGKKELSEANYQTIKIYLEPSKPVGFCDEELMLVSTGCIPHFMTVGHKSVYPPAGFIYGKFNWVNSAKFKYTGHNKFLRNEIYVTIGPDHKLYVKSSGNNFLDLEYIYLNGIFLESAEAAKMEEDCEGCYDECNLLDKHFPLDDSYLPTLMQVVTREIIGAAWNPQDDSNNATDDLSSFAQVLARYTNNKFKREIRGQDDSDDTQQS